MMSLKNQSEQAVTAQSSPWIPLEAAQRLLPWLAGAGMALGHAAVSSNCTIPQQGRCAACGSCILVVGSLAAWAMARQRRGDDFYSGGNGGA
jgi:hypothetical protein